MFRHACYSAPALLAVMVGFNCIKTSVPNPFQDQSAVPRRVLLTWSGNPATSASVTWRLDRIPAQAVAEIALASANPEFVKTAESVPAEVRLFTIGDAKVAYPRAVFNGLKPATSYVYRVGDGQTWSEWYDFKTAAAEPKPFRFVYFGDAQNDVKSMWSRVVRNAHRYAPFADFYLHAGDLINRADADHEWEEWFYAGGWIHATTPTIATPGNHEYTQGRISQLWRPQFDYPNNGIAGLEDSNYYIDFQGARIVSLNSLQSTEEQTAWLDKVLTDNPNRWTFLTFHYPMWSTAQGRDNKALRERWLPIILKHNVDLVLQGHDHTYGRKNVTSGVTARQRNTVFVVSVSGPKMYTLGEEAKTNMVKSVEKTQLFQIISVNGNRLDYEARTATGDLHDKFALVKQADGSSRLEQ